MKFTRKSFVGGINATYDRTKTEESAYPVGFNCRVRKNVVQGAFKPVRIQTPSGLQQAIFSLDDALLNVIAGAVYKIDPDTGNSSALSSQVLSPTAEIVYHQNVPAPTSFFMVGSNGELTYNSKVSTQPECVVLQDGTTQPSLVTPDLGVRQTKTYVEWSFNQPEYVPIGRQMCHNGNVLYIASADGRTIYRSVSGRPLDFVLAIDDATGEKRGDATSTSTAVATSKLTALIPAQQGGFLAFTYSGAYGVSLDYNVVDDFGEPAMIPNQLFPVGAVGQYAFSSANGQTLFVTSSGIVSFDQVAQALRESNNSSLGAPITDYLIRPIESVACAAADDYVFFAVSTIFGDGILVYDTQINTFVSIDLVGKIKEFAILRGSGVDRLFYITTSDELYEMPLYEGERSTYSLLLTYAAQDPRIRIRPESASLSFVNVKSNGTVTLITYVDNKFVSSRSLQLEADTNTNTNTPVAAIVSKNAKPQVLNFSLDEGLLGYSVSYELVCTAEADFATAVFECPESEQLATHAEETSVQTFRVLGNILPDEIYAGGSASVDLHVWMILYSRLGPAWVSNGGKRITALQGEAVKFIAQASNQTFDASSKLYDYSTLIGLITQNGTKPTDGLFILGDLGNDSCVPAFKILRMLGEEVHPVLGPSDQETLTLNAEYTAQGGKPIRYLVETDHVDFYCFSIPLPTADAEIDSGGNLVGPTPDEMLETGQFARWLSASIANRPKTRIPVVVFGYPPYSSSARFAPGFAALRWNFRKLGVKLVLANGRSYEHIYLNDVTYINVGTGSKSSLLEAGVPGQLEILAHAKHLELSFKDYLGYERDRASILI